MFEEASAALEVAFTAYAISAIDRDAEEGHHTTATAGEMAAMLHDIASDEKLISDAIAKAAVKAAAYSEQISIEHTVGLLSRNDGSEQGKREALDELLNYFCDQIRYEDAHEMLASLDAGHPDSAVMLKGYLLASLPKQAYNAATLLIPQ